MSDHCMIIAVFSYHLIAYQVVLECLPHALKQAPKDALLSNKQKFKMKICHIPAEPAVQLTFAVTAVIASFAAAGTYSQNPHYQKYPSSNAWYDCDQ